MFIEADLRESLCIQHLTLISPAPGLTSPPKNLTIASMGIVFASTEPLYFPALRTLDQSCVDIRNLPCTHTYRASVRHA